MTKLPLFAAALLSSTACTAAPQQDVAASAVTSTNPAQAAVVPVVPKDSPPPSVANVPATTGRANQAKVAPTFKIDTIGQFDAPFAMAFEPAGGLFVTEKGGTLKLRTPGGAILPVEGVPAVATGGQGGLLDVAVAPDYRSSSLIYLSFGEPGERGPALALARGKVVFRQVQCARAPCPPTVSLTDVQTIWRSGMNGPGGQFGANIAFARDGKSLFLSSGERQRFTPAQDPDQALGKILRLNLDGTAFAGNPDYKAGGVRAMTWSSGHRNPYGLAFDRGGRLWEVEMGPKGGDEVNLIEPGRNYGWPVVSNGDNYSGAPIPDHPSRPDLAAPKLWWNPSMSPGGMIVYTGNLFPAWRGSLLIAALSAKELIRVKLDGATASPGEEYDMDTRIRDVAQAPDGAVWLLEDGGQGAQGRLLRLTPTAKAQ